MKSAKYFRVWCALFILIFVCVSLHAGTFGSISGRITDAGGQGIANGKVTLSAVDSGPVYNVLTNDTGSFHFASLDPGTYHVKAEHVGMKTVEVDAVRVMISSTTRIKIVMQSESGIGSAGSGQADVSVQKDTPVFLFDADQSEADKLPGSEDVCSIFHLSGSEIGDGTDIHVNGAAMTDNLFLLDGIDLTDPVDSVFYSKLNSDIIREIDVLKGGFPAEYGRFMGGVLNMQTKTGGNDFHGIIRLRYVDPDWHDSSQHQNYYSGYPDPFPNSNNYWIPSLTLSGPILKDKLWFIANYSREERKSSRPLNYSMPGGEQIDRTSTTNFLFTKVTFQPRSDHRFTLVYSDGKTLDKNSSYTGYRSTYCRPEVFNDVKEGTPFFALEWNWQATSALSFETRFSKMNHFRDDTPANSDQPQFTDGGISYNGSSFSEREDKDRTTFSLTADFFMDDFFGTHEFRSGIELQKLQWTTRFSIPGGYFYYFSSGFWPDDMAADIRFRMNTPKKTEIKGDYTAFFIQDRWSVQDRLVIDAGVRYEYMKYENIDGETAVPAWDWGDFHFNYFDSQGKSRVSDMKFDDMIAPRLGITWNMTNDGRNILHAYYGRLYNPFNLSLPEAIHRFDTHTLMQFEYVGPEWHDTDGDGVPDEDYFFDDENWRYVPGTSDYFEDLIDPDLEAEYTDEFTLSFERKILDSITLTAAYTHCETNDMIEDIGLFIDEHGNIVWTSLGGVADDFSGMDPDKNFDPTIDSYYKLIYYITNAKGAVRKYNGLELDARIALKYLDMQASYTFSETKGTLTETSPGYRGITQFSGLYDTWATSRNLYGELPWSAKHVVKVSGAVTYPFTDWFETSLGVRGLYRSGHPYSKRTRPPKTYQFNDPSNDRNDPKTWTGVPPYSSYKWYFPEGRGTDTLPSVTVWDVSLQNKFRFGRWGALTVVLDIDNVFDHQVQLNESSEWYPPQTEYFEQGFLYQPPRSYSLSFKFEF